MFENAGEDPSGAMHRCEGDEGCTRWQGQKGDTYEEKLKACDECPRNCSPPPHPDEADDAADDDQEARELADRIEYLIAWEDAGIPTDWSAYTFDEKALFVIWRETEQAVKGIHTFRHQAWLKAQFKTDE